MDYSGGNLSAEAIAVIGKTDPEAGVSMPLIQHLIDTGHIASLLWDEWLPSQTKTTVAKSFNGNEVTARAALVLLAGLHDIGKATPAFCADKHDCRTSAVNAGLPMKGMDGEKKGEYHSLTGQVILEQYLQSVHGTPKQAARSLGLVVGAHHGTTPSTETLTTALGRPHHIGLNEQLWKRTQRELIDAILGLLEITQQQIGNISAQGLKVDAQIILSGVVIMADWLASDTENFPVIAADQLDLSDARAQKAWAALTLPSKWQPSTFASAQDGLNDRFASPDRAMTPRRFQEAVVQAAQQHDGLFIVEAPMGEGKTEAALIAAETIAARTGAGGVFVALPTQATSNGMFSRVLTWLNRTVGVDEESVRSVYLAHGKAMLNDEFTGLIGSDRMVTAHRWMTGRKRGLLAPFVVGTIDQILSGALRQKHLSMHHMSIVNKVVVLDEIHAVDTYMGSYLDKVLEWLGAYNVPVLALSATLPSSIRKRLMQSYDRSRGANVVTPAPLSLTALLNQASSGATGADHSVLDGDIGYPVISASAGGSTPYVLPVAPDTTRNKDINIKRIDDDLFTLMETVDSLLVNGGCVGIIRNTVSRAQETYRALKDAYGDDVILTHSRFVSPERVAREREIVSKLGPDKAGRPKRLIVVGTQVLEQSLDIDVDVLFTDMAPVDVVLQRIGRLHRHHTTVRPAVMAEPVCYVTGVDWNGAVPSPPGRKSFLVYPNALMYRSLAVLLRHTETASSITLPADISVMVQEAYADDFQPPSGWETVWATAQSDYLDQVRRSEAKASQHQLLGTDEQGDSMLGFANSPTISSRDDAIAATVRDIDPTYEVILLNRDGNGELWTLDSLPENAGRRVSTDVRPGRRAEKTAASSTVNIPAYALDMDEDQVNRELRKRYKGWQESTWLRERLLIELDSSGRAFVGSRVLEYRAETGLEIVKGAV